MDEDYTLGLNLSGKEFLDDKEMLTYTLIKGTILLC